MIYATKLTINQFKVPDYMMSKEFKERLKDLKRKHKRVDDEFLALFQKRFIIFIEDGTDLKEDCLCFYPHQVDKAWNHKEKMLKIDVNWYIAKYDFDVAKKLKPTNMSGVEYHEDF
jgi:hypothetical protein